LKVYERNGAKLINAATVNFWKVWELSKS